MSNKSNERKFDVDRIKRNELGGLKYLVKIKKFKVLKLVLQFSVMLSISINFCRANEVELFHNQLSAIRA